VIILIEKAKFITNLIMFGKKLEIKTKDLTIIMRPFYNEDEYSGFVKGRESQEIMRYFDISNAAITSKDTAELFTNQCKNKQSIMWALEVKETSKIIGYTQFWAINHIDRTAKTAIMIWDKEFWSKGVTSAVHQARTYYGAKLLNFVALYSYVNTKNSASSKSLEKTGYSSFGQLRSFYFVEGEYQDANHYVWYNPERISLTFPDGLPSDLEESVKRAKESLVSIEKSITWT